MQSAKSIRVLASVLFSLAIGLRTAGADEGGVWVSCDERTPILPRIFQKSKLASDNSRLFGLTF